MKNLVAKVVEPCEPWKWTGRLLVPAECIADKKKREVWAQNPETQYQMFSFYEGMNTSLRISETNQPIRLGAITVDADLGMSQREVDECIARLLVKPNWVEHTLSGHWRFHWLLEEALPLASMSHARHLMENIQDLVPVDQFPGVDKGALVTSSRYFTNSGDWRFIHDKPISKEHTTAFVMRQSKRFGWDTQMQGTSLVINEKIIERLKERWPRFCEWEGEFKVGTQGPTFFVDGSESAKSASVHEKGIYTWSAHAQPKYWWDWGDLLGANWVTAYESNRVGNAVREIYFDDKNYHLFSPITQTWICENKDNLTNELLVNRGLSREYGKKTGSKHSEIEGALNFIRHNQRIAGAASFAFYKKGILEWNGGKYLNTHTREVVQPASAAHWGPGGGFEWLSSFLDQFFTSKEQLPFFLSWLSRFYSSCFVRSPLSGQILFIAGPPNAGKTFLNRGVIGRLIGGHSDAKKFLLGQTDFNAQLFDHGYWCIDDGSVGSYATLHRYFSEMLKMIAANRDMESHAKFGKPSQVSWQGRCGLTCNNDAESLRFLPRMDINILDKIMLFLAAPRTMPFPAPADMEIILAREIPFFARFLLDYQIPAECLDDDPRFGVKSFHEPSLISSSQQMDSAFTEILDYWMGEHFTNREPNSECWEGTALQLRQEILKDPTMIDTMRSFDLDELKRRLTKLASGSLFKIDIINNDERRMKFRICRSTHYPMTTTPPPAAPTTSESKFGKQ